MPTEGTDEERFPELFFQTNIDRHGRKRTIPMEILCMGMMRTGTMSMRTAFAKLGYDKVYHMVSILQNPRDATMWSEAVDAKFYGKGKPYEREDWDALLGDSNACIDAPTACFMPELMKAYPDAKVILSMRDPDAWWKSVDGSVNKALQSWFLRTLEPMDNVLLGKWLPMLRKLMYGMWGPTASLEPVHAKKVYEDAHEEVRRLAPKGQLLEFSLKDGWEPLCEFLGKDVPNEPFPHVNETKEFGRRMELIMQVTMSRIARRFLPIMGAAMAATGAWYFLF